MTEKPLFIPLRTKWFRQFESGYKSIEYRAYGSRWNERVCRIGRDAIVSHGYSGERILYKITQFTKLESEDAPKSAREIYPAAEFIAQIVLARKALANEETK